MPNFAKTIEAAEERGLAASSFHRLEQLPKVEKGTPTYIRLISEDAYTCRVHQYIPTKDKPDDCTWANWPSSMWAVDRRDDMFRIPDAEGKPTDQWEEGYDGGCWICEHLAGVKDPKYGQDKGKPDVLSYGLAVIRKPRIDPGTRRAIGFEDETIEFRDQDGKVTVVPKIVVVAFWWKQFWQPVKAAAFLPPYSICDKDYCLTRGEDKKLVVTALPSDATLAPGTEKWKRYEQAISLTGADLGQYLVDHSTLDHYRRFFIPGESPEGGYGRPGNGDSDDAARDAASGPVKPTVSEEDMESLRADFGTRSAG